VNMPALRKRALSGSGAHGGRGPEGGSGPEGRPGDARAGGSLAPTACQAARTAGPREVAAGSARKPAGDDGRVHFMCDLASVRPPTTARTTSRPRDSVRGRARTSIRRADELRVAEHDFDGQSWFRRRNERGSPRSDQQR
jgi:hypothetical protein